MCALVTGVQTCALPISRLKTLNPSFRLLARQKTSVYRMNLCRMRAVRAARKSHTWDTRNDRTEAGTQHDQGTGEEEARTRHGAGAVGKIGRASGRESGCQYG